MRFNHNATRAFVGILICMFAVGCTAEHGEDNDPPSIQPGQNEQALQNAPPPPPPRTPPPPSGSQTISSPPPGADSQRPRQMRAANAPPPQFEGGTPDGEDGAPPPGAPTPAAVDAREACEAEALISATGPALVFNNPAALGTSLSLSNLLATLSVSGGGSSSQLAKDAIISSMLTSMTNSAYINSASGVTTPVEIRATEAAIDPATFIDDMLPVAVFNRLDLMSESDCGEHRIIYSLDPTSSIKQAPFHKFTVIFEARYPNPNPELGAADVSRLPTFGHHWPTPT